MLGISSLLPFLKAVCQSKKSWQAHHTIIHIVQQIAIMCSPATLAESCKLQQCIVLNRQKYHQVMETKVEVVQKAGARWCSGTPPLGDSSSGQASILPTSLFRLPPPPLSRASVFQTLSIQPHRLPPNYVILHFPFETSLQIAYHSLASPFDPFPFRLQHSEYGLSHVATC